MADGTATPSELDERDAPRLILLNGPPASGKSTLARRYVADHPLALNLDIDLMRRQIGGWQDRSHESGLLARALALACARAHLGAGLDVVVPQLLARPAFIELLEALAREMNARFVEVVLVLTQRDALRRFEERTRTSREPAHAEAAAVVALSGGQEYLRAVHRDLSALITTRQDAVLLDVRADDVEAVYRRLLTALAD